MTMKKAIAGLCVVVTMTGVSNTALADDSGFYVVGAVGQARGVSKSNTDASLTALGATGYVSSMNSNATAYKFLVGYQLNTNFAIEGGYVNVGKFDYTATGGNLISPVSLSAKSTGWGLDAVGILPLGNQFSGLGKLGVAQVSTSCSSSANVVASCPSKTDLTYGLGVKYDLTSAVSLRGDWDSYKGGSGQRANVWTVGVGYKF